MGYENTNTNRRRQARGTKAAAEGRVPKAGRTSAMGAAEVKPMTVDGRTFMAAAVLLSIDAFLNKRDAVACQEGKEVAA